MELGVGKVREYILALKEANNFTFEDMANLSGIPLHKIKNIYSDQMTVAKRVSIGSRIKEARIQRGLSQRDLAKRMGYSNHSTISKIESGKIDIPQSRIVQFADVLGVTVAYLMN